MKKTSVMIVDDHAVVRMGLSAIINLEKEFSVCGESENGEEAVRMASSLMPDVIIMDLVMPGMDGVETTKAILDVSPSSHVLILTTFGSAADISRALKAGATGAVTKNLSNDDLMKAIRSTRDGVRYVSPEIEKSLNEYNGEISLSPRQREVLDSITRGLSNDNIATLLGISKSRVKQHLNELYEKIGAANRAEAVSIALRKQLLKL
jgi:NarL family two-component system response regulator LiaR